MELLSRDGDDKEDDNKDSQESWSQVTVYSDLKEKDKEKDPVNTLSVSPVSAQSPASSATLEYTEDDTSSFYKKKMKKKMKINNLKIRYILLIRKNLLLWVKILKVLSLMVLLKLLR